MDHDVRVDVGAVEDLLGTQELDDVLINALEVPPERRKSRPVRCVCGIHIDVGVPFDNPRNQRCGPAVRDDQRRIGDVGREIVEAVRVVVGKSADPPHVPRVNDDR